MMLSIGAECSADAQLYSTKPQTIRDLMWVWGNVPMPDNSEPSLGNYAQCSPIQRAQLLAVPNVIMAGNGLPLDEPEARQLYQDVGTARTLVWEFSPDGGAHHRDFVYDKRLALLQKLIADYPRPPVVGVLLDDMSSLSVAAGLKPDHVARLRRSLPAGVKLWGVVYTMTLGLEGIDDIIKEFDVINLWVWHAADVVHLEEYIGECERRFPDKPIVLGLYLHDYGGNRPMPHDLHYLQAKTAVTLAHAQRIEGMILLTITDAAPILQWTVDWIKRVGDQKIGQQGSWDRSPARNEYRITAYLGRGKDCP